MTMTSYMIRNAINGDLLITVYSKEACASMQDSFARYGTRTVVEVGKEVW